MNRSCRADELIEFKYKHTFICKMCVCVHRTHSHTPEQTHSHLHILYQFGEANKPNFFERRFFFARSAINSFVYINVCLSECGYERARWCGTHKFKKVVYVCPKYIFIYYFVLCHFFDIWTIWCVRECVCLCLVAKIVAVCCYCYCCCLVRCVLLCRRSRYFLHAIVLGK